MPRIHAGDWDAFDGSEAAFWANNIQNMSFYFYSNGKLFYKNGDLTISIAGYFPPLGGGETPASYDPSSAVDSVQMLDSASGLGFAIYELSTTLGEVLQSSSPFDLVGPDVGIQYFGSKLGDTIIGTGNDDSFYGGAGDDIVTAGSGNDVIDGQDGVDTAIYSGTSYDYGFTTITVNSTTYYRITDLRSSGSEGTDTLRNLERIQFSNGIKFLDGSQPDELDERPHSLQLSNTTIAENSDEGLLVGSLSAVDPEGTDMVFTLTDDANGAFRLDGLDLIALKAFDAETTPSVEVSISVKDGFGFEVSKSFTISISNVDEPPQVSSPIEDVTVEQDAFLKFSVPADSFVDLDSTLSYSASLADGSPLPAWLTFDANVMEFSGTPGNDEVGNVTIKVTASGDGQSVSDAFDITVTNVNDAPTGSANATLADGIEDTVFIAAAADLISGFSDPDGDTLSVDNLTASDGATVTDNGDGTYTITPAADFNGTVTLSYDVIDGNGGSAPATQTVAFLAINDAPVAVDDSASMFQHTTAIVGVLLNDTDSDSDNLFVSSAEVTSGNGSVSIDNDGTLSVQYTGADIDDGETALITITYMASDGSLSAEGTLTVTVDGVDIDPGEDIRGDNKANKLMGTTVSESIFGLGGKDKLYGNGGDDHLYGGKGKDTLFGGDGLDTFHFAKKDGKDIVMDFEDGDIIDLSGVSSITGWKDLIKHHLVEKRGDLVISFDKSNGVTLDGVDRDDVGKGDFLF